MQAHGQTRSVLEDPFRRRAETVEELRQGGALRLRGEERVVAAEKQLVRSVMFEKMAHLLRRGERGVGVDVVPLPDAGPVQGLVAAVQAAQVGDDDNCLDDFANKLVTDCAASLTNLFQFARLQLFQNVSVEVAGEHRRTEQAGQLAVDVQIEANRVAVVEIGIAAF